MTLETFRPPVDFAQTRLLWIAWVIKWKPLINLILDPYSPLPDLSFEPIFSLPLFPAPSDWIIQFHPLLDWLGFMTPPYLMWVQFRSIASFSRRLLAMILSGKFYLTTLLNNMEVFPPCALETYLVLFCIFVVMLHLWMRYPLLTLSDLVWIQFLLLLFLKSLVIVTLSFCLLLLVKALPYKSTLYFLRLVLMMWVLFFGLVMAVLMIWFLSFHCLL